MRSSSTSFSRSFSSSPSASAWQGEAVRKVARAISEEPVFPVQMEALCALAEMTPFHLERAFHLSLGMSLNDYARLEWRRNRRGVVTREWLIAAI